MEPVEVPVGACRCPGTPHEEDVVYLAPELGFEAGLAVEAAMSSSTDQTEQTLAVALALVRRNVLGWTFVDEEGKPEPVNNQNIERLLPYARGGEAVANKAAGLYLKAVLDPLERRARGTSSRSSLTNGQTRPILSSHKPSQRKRSPRSSRAGSAGQP
jgi:hypothetical protein